MKILSLLVPLCIFACVCNGVETVADDGIMPVNGSFNADIQGWKGTRMASKDGKMANVAAPEFVTFVADDGVGEPKGCIKISFKNVDSNCVTWTSGAYMEFKKNLPPEIKIKVSFYAKSLKGSRRMIISRPAGGGTTDTVMISDQWQQYELVFSSKFDTPGLYFGIVDHYSPRGNIENGEFLLDNITVTIAEPVK